MELTIDQALQKGIEAHRSGKATEADQYYTAILKANPNHPDANHNMGVLAVQVGKIDKAIPFFEKALESNLSISQFWLSYIDALLQLGDLKKAKETYLQAEKQGVSSDVLKSLSIRLFQDKDQNTKAPKAIIDKAIELRESGEFDEAIKTLEAGLKNFSNDENILALLSHCAILNNDLELASRCLNKAKTISSDNSLVCWNQARLLLKRNNIIEAVSVARQGVERHPQDAEGYLILGSCLRANSILDEALSMLDQALKLQPNYAEALINRGLINLTKKNKNDALVDLERAHKLKPHIKEIWDLVVGLKIDFLQIEDIIPLTEVMVKIDPENEKVFATMAFCHQRLSNFEAATNAYKKAIAIKPDYADAYSNMGLTLKEQGKLEEAIEAYRSAVSINPNLVEAYHNMGIALQTLGRVPEAIEAYDKSGSQASVAKALECTFFLEDFDEFNIRVRTVAKKDPFNIRAAAISAYAAHQLKNDDPYPFCKNPIEKLHYAKLKDHFSEPNKFIEDLLDEMNDRDALWEPSDKTTKKGFQTNEALFAQSSPNLKKLEDFIRTELRAYKKKFQKSKSVLINKWPQEFRISAWYVRMLQDGHQSGHIHANGWVSGVMYLKTVTDPIQNEGAIKFGLRGYEYPIIEPDYPQKTFQPSDGDLVLFPSSLFHETIPVIKNVERCVIAFDLVPEKNIN